MAQANPLHGWLSRNLEYTGSLKDFVALGATTDPEPGALYSSYTNYCRKVGAKPLTPRTFPHSLLHTIQGKGISACKILRGNEGNVLIAARLKHSQGFGEDYEVVGCDELDQTDPGVTAG